MRQGWKKRLLAAVVLMTMGGVPGVLAENAGTTVVTNVTNINVYKTEEIKGTELGTDARARGTGSIATGKGAIAIGKNAVATGGNETKASIEAKLAENQAKLDEITSLEQSTNQLATELTELRNTSASVIEAGQRVEAVKIAKTQAYDNWQAKEKEYQDAVTASQTYLDEQQAKIDDLNSRLTGVSQLTNTDISSDEGLTKAAEELKAIAEKDTTLNLSTDFYKDYVSSYYKALGDLRQANSVYSKASSGNYYISRGSYDYSCNEKNMINTYKDSDSYVSAGIQTFFSELEFYSSGKVLYTSAFKNSTVTNVPSANISLKDTDTDITTQTEWETAQAAAPEWKAALAQFWTDCNNPMLSDEAKEAYINQMNLKVDYYLKTNEITYYQG